MNNIVTFLCWRPTASSFPIRGSKSLSNLSLLVMLYKFMPHHHIWPPHTAPSVFCTHPFKKSTLVWEWLYYFSSCFTSVYILCYILRGNLNNTLPSLSHAFPRGQLLEAWTLLPFLSYLQQGLGLDCDNERNLYFGRQKKKPGSGDSGGQDCGHQRELSVFLQTPTLMLWAGQIIRGDILATSDFLTTSSGFLSTLLSSSFSDFKFFMLNLWLFEIRGFISLTGLVGNLTGSSQM